MSIVSSLALISAIFLLAVSPGPGVFATVSRAISSGFGNAAILVIGIVAGDILFLLLAIFGLSFMANILGNLFMLVKYAGGIYLIYLGYKIWTSETSTHEIVGKSEISWKSNFISGLLITLANPKVIIFYLGFLPAFIDLQLLYSIDIAIVVLIVSITLGSVLLGYAYMASRAKRVLKSQKAIKNINRVSGSVMVGAGSLLLLKS
jgi:threonine/homoserine/homoserine lactone efflux protein